MTMATRDAAIVLRGLHHTFAGEPPVPVLRDLTLEVPAGALSDKVELKIRETRDPPPPAFDAATLARIAERTFGLSGVVTLLDSERDQNARLATSAGTTLAFKRSDTLVFGGAVSGAGGLAQLGTGTTVLTGSHTYTGGTTWNTSRLVIGANTYYTGPAANPTIISGPFGTGKRMKLAYTRAMIHAALAGELDAVAYARHPIFNVEVPASCPGVPAEVLDPRGTWADPEAYDAKARELAAMFVKNFERFDDVAPGVAAAGPRL